MLIADMIKEAREIGYGGAAAESKACQDIVLMLIAQSRYNRNVTVKGGVVMRGITNSARRATLDMDLDFIKYSLHDDSIDRFIVALNVANEINVRRIGNIEELKQQDYHGKRAYIELIDSSGYTITTKIDFGVHKHYDIEQEEFCFDVGINDIGVNLLVNSKEQIIAEKLRSVLKFGSFSTRYKDVFDIYYLSDKINRNKLEKCLDVLIYSDVGMRENTIEDIIKRVEKTFNDKIYINRLKSSDKNWLNEDIDRVCNSILTFLKSMV